MTRHQIGEVDTLEAICTESGAKRETAHVGELRPFYGSSESLVMSEVSATNNIKDRNCSYVGNCSFGNDAILISHSRINLESNFDANKGIKNASALERGMFKDSKLRMCWSIEFMNSLAVVKLLFNNAFTWLYTIRR